MSEPPSPYPQDPYAHAPYYPQEPYAQQPYAQQPYAQGPYPPNPYGAGPYPPAGAPAGPGGSRLRRGLGGRLYRRPDARSGPALAAAGAAMVVIGLLIWSVGYLAHGVHVHVDFRTGRISVSGGGRRFLGAVLFALLTLAGYAVTILRRRGPLATAGTVAGIAGLPLTIIFGILDVGGVFKGHLPVNFDVLFPVVIVVWLASYFVVPGARGRSAYLGLAAMSLVSYIALKAAGTGLVHAGASAANGNVLPGAGMLDQDTNTIATIGLTFGLLYYAAAAILDFTKRPGAATGMVFAGFTTTVSGVFSAARAFGQAGTGVTLVLLGALLAWYGGRADRRFTTWAWSVALLVGAVVLVAKIPTSRYTLAGIVLAVIGIGVVVGAQLLARVTREPLDLDERDSARPA